MNHTAFNTTASSCGGYIDLGNISLDLRAVLIVRIVVSAFTCPLTTVLNILVMVAVKTTRQLRTKSNVALACLSTTDLIVEVVLQPLHITAASLLLNGERMSYTITGISESTSIICILASLHNLVLMSAERYIVIKHPFRHETQVSEVRIIMASALAWAAAIILYNVGLLQTTILIASETLLLILPIYCNVSVYKEVRRNEKQIAANQVSLEAKKKILRNRKAFYTTVIITLVILLCFFPFNICLATLSYFKSRISPNVGLIVLYILTLLPVLNSLINPLIYAVRIRNFRVAFIQILSRKTAAQAEEVERKIFGQRQIAVNGNINERQGNQTINDKQEPARQTEPHDGCEETPL